MPNDSTSTKLPPNESEGEPPIIAHWPGDWPGRQFVDLDCVGDPGWWLDVNVASEADLMEEGGDDYWPAAALADDYIRKGRELGFPMPSDRGVSAEDQREQVVEEFIGFIKEWRRRTMAEREANRAVAGKAAGPFQTWVVLQEFGFEPDAEVVYSDIRPGLSFDFGNFKLSASAVMGRSFQDVVLFTGILRTPRTLAEVQFEMPRQIKSREKCAAWLAWHLDKYADDHAFQPQVAVDWLEQGRTSFRLLPWYFDQEAYEARPHCSVDKELARPLLKNLAKIAEQVPPEEKVWFSFDGEVLKIRAGKELLALAANGKPWSNRYGLNAVQLTKPIRRLLGERVWFESWEDYFTIARCRYLGVVIEPASQS